jgi:DNA-binding response OmpR family regulator
VFVPYQQYQTKGGWTGLAKRILCVDDDKDTCAMMTALLQLSGYEVTASNTISDALLLVERGSFDLFILDATFPDGKGVDLCERIRALDPHTPILFLSGRSDESVVDNAMSAGAQAYLTKPVDVDALEETVARLLN